MDYNKLSARALWELLTLGDERAFAEVYKRYWKKLFILASRQLKSREAAEEIIQDIFLSLWDKKEFYQIDDLERYLVGSVKHKVINYVRNLLQEQRYAEYMKIRGVEWNTTTENQLSSEEIIQAIERSIGALPEKTREVFKLSRFEHLPHKTIAQKLELSEKSVEYHITQALKWIREHLREFITHLALLIIPYL